MVRSITTDAVIAKNSQFGSEPICVLGIKWGGGQELKYSTRTIPFAKGIIQSLSSLSEAIQLNNNATTTSITVVLSDTDGSLKAIMDSNDIHKNKCKLYQWFDGLDESDAFVIFSGEINSPIVWNEAERTLSFSMLSIIESIEVGFSPEQGQFADISPNLIGKVWPLVFGEAVHVPAVKSIEKLRGSTQTLIGIPDYTLPYKYWHLRERLQILQDGFNYYKNAIYYLLETLPRITSEQDALLNFLSNPRIEDADAIDGFFQYISYAAQGLEDRYVNCILLEDSQKQSFEDINIFITQQGKISDDVKALNNDDQDDTELNADDIETLLEKLENAFDEFEDLVEENTSSLGTVGDGSHDDSGQLEERDDETEQTENDSIISVVGKAIQETSKQVPKLIAASDFNGAVDQLSGGYIALLDGAKKVSELTQASLTTIAGEKEIIVIDIENSEYAFQHIRTILHKINKLFINVYKTEREIYKIATVIQQHNAIPKYQVVVTNGENFPQNTQVSIVINNMTYLGSFSGKLFTATAIQPRYSNLAILTYSRLIDSFDLADPTVDLRGQFCLISVRTNPSSPDYDPTNPYGYRVFQISNQIGTRCTIQLLELNPTNSKRQNLNKLPLIDQLPDYLATALNKTNEHTKEQKKRILEEAIPKYDARDLARIKENLEKYKTIAQTADDDDTVNSINDTIYKNIREYNQRVSNLTYKKEAIDRVNERISSEEFKHLIRLQNLKYRLHDQDDEDYEIIQTDRFYYVTGFDVQYIIAASPVMLPAWFQFASQGQELEQNSTVIQLPNGSRIKANLLPDSALWYAEVGSSVELANAQSEKYIANILPSTIASVYAFRNLNGLRQLVPVPSSYYTKNESDQYGPLTVTSITLKRRLQDYPNEGWENDVFVSMASSVGPNTADIISWIAENYTDLIVDSVSFNSVRTLIQNYPSSFALFDKKDALTLMREIAWQARCAIWASDGVLYIQYLSQNPTSIGTITEAQIIPGSLELQHTTTEDLVTKFTANWKPDYTVTEPNQLIYRYNIAKYGTIEGDYDFYIYNIEDLVAKSATFWLIRRTNTWKLAVFKTPLLNLQFQSFDGMTLNITPNYFAANPVLGVVQNAEYAIEDNTIEFTVWLPIRSGEQVPYDFAFPSSIDVTKVYPTIDEVSNGYAGSSSSNVPTNVAFHIDPNINLIDQLVLRPSDFGRPFLSDQFDTYPDSVLANLREEDYITVTPEKYSMPPDPMSSDVNTKPEYTTPETEVSRISEPAVFVGRINSVVDADTGIYTVAAGNNKIYEVQQYNGGGNELSENDPVTVIREPMSGKLVINQPPAPTGNTIAYYKIISEDGDYVLCNPYDIDSDKADETMTVPVAKPRLLQKKPFDGKTISLVDKDIIYTYDISVFGLRLAQTTVTVYNPGGDNYISSITEAQRILPRYYKNDIITAFKGPTGLKYTPTKDKSQLIVWTDMNTGGRVWAHDSSSDPNDTDGA